MTTKRTRGEKKVKGYCVIDRQGNIRFARRHMGVRFEPRFATKKSSLDFYWWDDKVVPCTITYKLVAPKSKLVVNK